MLVDYISDPQLTVLKDKLKTIPGTIQRLEKIASPEVPERGELSEQAFAWPEEKLFPIYTPELAMISSVYMEENDSVPDFVKVACEDACQMFGEDVAIGHLEKVSTEKEELSAREFVFPKRKKLPLVDKDSHRMSTEIFTKIASTLSMEDLIVGSRQIVKTGAELSADVSPEVGRYALNGIIDVHIADDFLNARYLDTGDVGYAHVAQNLEGETIRSITKVASLVLDIAELDEANSLVGTAAETIDSLLLPGSNENILSVGGVEFDFEKVAMIDSSEWRELYPDTIVEGLFKNGDIDINILSDISDNSGQEEVDALVGFIQSKN